MLELAKTKAIEKRILSKCKNKFQEVLENHVEKKSKHQLLLEGLDKINEDEKKA